MSSAVEKQRTYSEYTEAEIHRALVEVAACSGNTHMAARNLEADEDAPSVIQQTLWKWKARQHKGRYERIQAEILPMITREAAEQHMALARQQMSLSAEANALVALRLPQMEDKDLINALGKADIGSGIHSEKAQLLAGQPTAIVENNLSDLKRALEARGIGLVIEGTATEEDVLEIAVAEPAVVDAAVTVPASHGDPVNTRA